MRYHNHCKDAYGIKNVCFSAIDKNSPHWGKYKAQRKERGFDDSELWSLDVTLFNFLIPRLKRLKEIKVGYPLVIYDFDENGKQIANVLDVDFKLSDKEKENAKIIRRSEEDQLVIWDKVLDKMIDGLRTYVDIAFDPHISEEDPDYLKSQEALDLLRKNISDLWT